MYTAPVRNSTRSPHARLEIVPVRIGALQQRHVVGVLEIGFPDQAGIAAARTVLVRDAISFEPEHATTAPRELIERGRPHRTESDDDHVVVARLRHRCGPAANIQPRIRTRALNWVNGVEPREYDDERNRTHRRVYRQLPLWRRCVRG